MGDVTYVVVQNTHRWNAYRFNWAVRVNDQNREYGHSHFAWVANFKAKRAFKRQLRIFNAGSKS